MPDDVPLLRRLEAESLLVLTPPQDYDDSYCLDYARSHGGCVMSNDLYRDQVQAAQKRGDTRQAISAMQARLAKSYISMRHESITYVRICHRVHTTYTPRLGVAPLAHHLVHLPR